MELQLPEDSQALTKHVAHRLPCNVQVDGPAPTARAFCPFPEPIPSFRGRKMQPGCLDIPEFSQRTFRHLLGIASLGLTNEYSIPSNLRRASTCRQHRSGRRPVFGQVQTRPERILLST